MIVIASAQSGAALEHIITLAQEYVAWMTQEIRERYPEFELDEMTSKHDYDDIRQKFPGEHVPPHGCLLIARRDKMVCGCIALGRLTDTICEMRTLYVRPACRSGGVGKKLVEACLNEARTFGYKSVRLDTLAFMESAQNLYRSMGFYAIEPYLEMSPSLKRHICFFERKLSDQKHLTEDKPSVKVNKAP